MINAQDTTIDSEVKVPLSADAWARRFFLFVTAHPVAVLLLGALTALALGAGSLRLTRQTSPDAFIPPQHPALSGKREIDRLFGLAEPIAVGVICDTPEGVFNPHSLALVRDLTAAIQTLPQVQPTDVLSLATESGVAFDAQGEPGFERIMKQVPADAASCRALRDDFLSYELYRGTLVAADGKAACIVIRLRSVEQADSLYAALNRLITATPVREERLVVAGEAVVRARMGKAVSDDALRMNLFSPVVMVFLIALAYRTGRGTLLPMCVVGAASAAALGLMGWSGVPVYIVTNGLFVIIMALSVCYALHLLGQYYEEQLNHPEQTRQQVVVRACVTLWYPVLMTSLTDFTGFLAIYFTGGMPPIAYFGLFTCVGVLAALAYTYTVLPAGLAILPLRLSPAFARHHDRGRLDWLGAAMGRLGAFVWRQQRLVLLVWAATVVLAGWGASRLVVNDARILAFKDRHPIVQATRALNERFDGTSELNVVVHAAQAGAILQPEVLRRIEALEAFTETLPHVGGTHSVAGWVKRAHQKLNGDKPEFYAIPNDPTDTRFYLDALGAPACPMARLLREVVDPTYTAANLIVRMRSSEFIHQREVIRRLEEYLAAHFPDAALRTQLAGRVHLDYQWLRMVRTSHIQGVVFSALCTLVLTAWMFRSWCGGGLCTLIVGLVVLIDYAIMGMGRIPLGVGTSMFASIAIGTGVNFPILILERLRAGFRTPGAPPERVFVETSTYTGRAAVFAALIVAIGLLLLCVSEFRTLVEFGLLIGLAMLVSLLASVTLLPALVAAWRPRFVWHPLASGQGNRGRGLPRHA